jgi:hypothetical protein
MAQCSAKCRDGRPCRAQALDGERYCFFHSRDPQRARQLRLGRRAGGHEIRKRHSLRVLPAFPDVNLTSAADVRQLLSATICRVMRGEIEVRIANCVAYCASVALNALAPPTTSGAVVQFLVHEPGSQPCGACHESGITDNATTCSSCAGKGFLPPSEPALN